MTVAEAFEREKWYARCFPALTCPLSPAFPYRELKSSKSDIVQKHQQRNHQNRFPVHGERHHRPPRQAHQSLHGPRHREAEGTAREVCRQASVRHRMAQRQPPRYQERRERHSPLPTSTETEANLRLLQCQSSALQVHERQERH